MKLDKTLAQAIALDTGDRHRREHGRVNQPWNEDDWNAACAEYVRLLAIIDAEDAIE